MKHIFTYSGTHKLIMLLIAVLWGYAWALMKMALDYMGPFTFSTLRFATGTCTMLIVLMLIKKVIPPKNLLKHFMILGIFQTTLVFLLVMFGMQFVEAGKSSVLLYSMPIWSAVLAQLFLKEKITRIKWLGILIGSFGLTFMIGWDFLLEQHSMKIIGELLIVLAAVSWAISNIYYQHVFRGVDQLQVTAYQMLFGTIGLMLATLITEWGEPVQVTPNSMYIVVYTGVIASAFCFTCWFYLLRRVDTVTVTISSLLVPVFGVLFSWLTLHEPITTEIAVGTALIISGIFMTKNGEFLKKWMKRKSTR
ncbi:MAG: DMT family transporter [Bacillaceae bacterium]|nr:DMT family transporter [Bacillaceae bacterium]